MENKINISDIKIGDRVLVSGCEDPHTEQHWGEVLEVTEDGKFSGFDVKLDDQNLLRAKDSITLDGVLSYYAWDTEVHDHKPKLHVVPDLPAKPAQGALADIQNTLDYLKKVTGVEHKPMTQEIELGIPNGNGSAGYIMIKFVREEA